MPWYIYIYYQYMVLESWQAKIDLFPNWDPSPASASRLQWLHCFSLLTHEHLSYNCIIYAQYAICQSVYNSEQNLLCFTRLFTIYTNNNIVAVPTTILIPTDPRIRQFHPFTYWYRHLHAFKDPYKYSFFPNKIIHWNLLPQTIVLCPTVNTFREQLTPTVLSHLQSQI